MTYTTILEKLFVIVNLISKSWIDVAVLGMMILLVLLFAFKKLSKRNCFLLSAIACFCLLGYTIFNYYDELGKMMNTLIDKMFTTIYFPSVYAYLFILVVMDVVSIFGLLKPKGEKILKSIHGVVIIVIHFVLAMILKIVATDNVDIFSKKSLFSNTNLVTLLEFSMNIFIIWIVAMLMTRLVHLIADRIMIAKENKILKNNAVNMTGVEAFVEVQTPDFEKEYLDNDKKKAKKPVLERIRSFGKRKDVEPVVLETVVPEKVDEEHYHFIPTFGTNRIVENTNPELYQGLYEENQNTLMVDPDVVKLEDTSFDLSSFIPKKQEVKPIQNVSQTSMVFEQILNNEFPVIQNDIVKGISSEELERQRIEAEKNSYTLNDYRIFNKMLKDIREHNQSNSVTIDKNLEYRLITKYSYDNYDMFKRMLKIYSN